MSAGKWMLGVALAGGAVTTAAVLARPSGAATATATATASPSPIAAAPTSAARDATKATIAKATPAMPPPSIDLAATTTTTATAALPSSAPVTAARSFTIDVVAFAPWGSGPSDLGHTRPSEGNPEAPMSLAVDEAGEVLVLDQVNERVQVFSPAGAVVRSIPTSSNTVQDLAIDSGGAGVWLLDRLAARSLRLVDLAGVERKRVDLLGQGVAEGGAVTALFSRADGVWVEIEHRRLVRVATASGGADPLRPSLEGRPTTASGPLLRASRDPSGGAAVSAIATSSSGGFFTQVAFRDPLLQLLALGDDARGGVLVAAHTLREDPYPPYGVAAEGVTVVDLSSSGAERGRFDLPAPEGPEETFRTVAIAPNGDVYHLHVGRLGATIRRAR